MTVCIGEFCARKRRTLTVSSAGLIEDVFLEGHLLFHGGECVIIILEGREGEKVAAAPQGLAPPWMGGRERWVLVKWDPAAMPPSS